LKIETKEGSVMATPLQISLAMNHFSISQALILGDAEQTSEDFRFLQKENRHLIHKYSIMKHLLQAAVQGKESGIIDALKFKMALDIDINKVKDSNGNTALHLAVKNGHVSLVRLLLQSGATSSLTNNSGDSCQQLAQGKNEILTLLQSPSAQVPYPQETIDKLSIPTTDDDKHNKYPQITVIRLFGEQLLKRILSHTNASSNADKGGKNEDEKKSIPMPDKNTRKDSPKSGIKPEFIDFCESLNDKVLQVEPTSTIEILRTKMQAWIKPDALWDDWSRNTYRMVVYKALMWMHTRSIKEGLKRFRMALEKENPEAVNMIDSSAFASMFQ